MSWQDLTISSGQAVFILSLFRMARNPATRIARAEALTTGSILVSFGVVYASYGMWVSVLTTAACAGLWGWIGWKRPVIAEDLTVC